MENLTLDKGQPYPFGVSKSGENTLNFAIVSVVARSVSLCLFERATRQIVAEIPIDPQNKTGDVWHIALNDASTDLLYAYRVDESPQLLLDPYAKGVSTGTTWGNNNTYQPLGEIIVDSAFDWEEVQSPQLPLKDLIIYEMHVRGFTQHSSSKVKHPGTYLGVIEKIPHLLDLGINAIELLPSQEFNENEYTKIDPISQKPLLNFWGYSTVNFFAPMSRYASDSMQHGAAINEFKTMVRELHKNHIEVILDVVFNHTAEGNERGPTLSFKGLDPEIYYMFDSQGKYQNFSGCGNTFNANHPIVIEFIISCLRYWTTEMHVDGFRFDLASALMRGSDGRPLSIAPLIKAITKDPILADVKLIAEPWDAAGLYQVGSFAPDTTRWSEWNGKYRDTVRRFIKGTPWINGEFAMRLCGSEDLYHYRGPTTSLNFVIAHDGFTLADLVSYNNKHNRENGEENQDGSNDNDSWNCGHEGPTKLPSILALRQKQMRNHLLALMISQGVPMIHMGDEYGHTKNGNNNTWCQDNELNWFLWDQLHSNEGYYRFYRLMIQFRKQHPFLQRTSFLKTKNIDWHGTLPFKPNWTSHVAFIAMTLHEGREGKDIYIAFNAHENTSHVELPNPPRGHHWQWVVNTANDSPEDIYEGNTGPHLEGLSYPMSPFSAIVLQS